ncbi:perakine reductase-like [Tripterygium wilfordii]|uniref:perakine reductase-like n=1 Tax=Tripterygium wilfordii TaxID=458696 RepID=UPI0018F822F2|nr:perakine reductase-like [Tripterygium wilfordii]
MYIERKNIIRNTNNAIKEVNNVVKTNKIVITADSSVTGNKYSAGVSLEHFPREEVQLATKFGIIRLESGEMGVKGTLEHFCSCCLASLQRVDVEYIDLYYAHRIDTSTPLEDTVNGELKKLVEEGKIKYIGLSEASPGTIRRAPAVHPITALQMEYSLWTPDIEDEIIPLCRELGIEIVPYSPLGRGIFGGKAVVVSLPANTYLESHPRFLGENFEKNKILYNRVKVVTEKHDCSPAQLALAWVLHQGDDVRTTKVKNFDHNIGSLNVRLTKEDLNEISDAIPIDEVAGLRQPEQLCHHSWKFADMPTKHNETAT